MIAPVGIERDSTNTGFRLAIAFAKLLGNFVGDGLVHVVPFSNNTREGSLSALEINEKVSHLEPGRVKKINLRLQVNERWC